MLYGNVLIHHVVSHRPRIGTHNTYDLSEYYDLSMSQRAHVISRDYVSITMSTRPCICLS